MYDKINRLKRSTNFRLLLRLNKIRISLEPLHCFIIVLIRLTKSESAMKSFFFLIVFITVSSCRENSKRFEETYSSEKTNKEINSPEIPPKASRELISIEDIKNEHSYISSVIASGGMDSTSFNYNCRDEKKGTVSYFYDKGQLRKIEHTSNEYSHFSATDEYYLKDGTLFFVFRNHLVWSFVTQDQTKDNITEKRIYILNNKPVMCLKKEFTILSDEKKDSESNRLPNEEVECSSLEPISEDFKLLFELRNQKEDLDCL